MRRLPLFVAVMLLPLSVFAEVPQRYIVMTRQPFRQAIRAIADEPRAPRIGANAVGFESINGYAADLTPTEVMALRKSPNVVDIEPNLERHALEVKGQTDAITPGQQITAYGVTMVNAPSVWPVTKGKSLTNVPVHVAIIDTGVLYTDPEFAKSYAGGHNFINGTDDPMDDNGHGTHVAGIIAAADDGAGVVGVAPDVDFYSLKVLDHCGSGSVQTEIQAVDWVIAKKAAIGGNWVINLSLGSPDPSQAEQAAFQSALDNGVLAFAASGNEYDATSPTATLDYPAGYSTVVSVGAIDSTKAIADFSNRGPDLKVVAPGVDVLSTWRGYLVKTDDGRTFPALQMDAVSTTNSSQELCLTEPNLTALAVVCGVGNPSDFPPSVAGNIALIERGGTDASGQGLTFAAKTANAKAAGAIATIVYNTADRPMVNGYLGTFKSASVVPTACMIARADGLNLLSTPNARVTLTSPAATYTLLQGTSMATPHAAGVAALVWATTPSASPTNVATAIEQTAADLGAAGFDNTFGFGLVDAYAAAKQLNPTAFSSPAQPPVPHYSGRYPGRRGH